MSVGVTVGEEYWEVGSPDFLFAFFSTISHHLEPEGWGSAYPELMNQLYQGGLDEGQAQKVLADLNQIKERLRAFKPSELIWNIRDLTAKPPWSDNVHPSITSLATYFVTSDGRDLFDVLIEALDTLVRKGGSLRIVSH